MEQFNKARLEEMNKIISAYEYNPSQKWGVHTGNTLLLNGQWRKGINNYGWTAICYGPMIQIDALAEEEYLYNIVHRESPRATIQEVRDAVGLIIANGKYSDIKLFNQ